MDISEILAKYDSDKVTVHYYGPTYDGLFRRFDRNKDLDVLEIGVQRGGSLMAWAEYFPHARVTGVDIVDVRDPRYRSDRVTFILGDIKEVPLEGTFDIIIDDGSHMLPDVLAALKKGLPLLKPGGIIVIEDVQHPKSWVWNTAKIAGIGRLLTGKFFYRDLRKIKGGFDDFLIIVKK